LELPSSAIVTVPLVPLALVRAAAAPVMAPVLIWKV
jgi:hypothetical protein